MEISVFGLGYVGLATSLYFAEMGHCVAGIDIDSTKIDELKLGHAPFFEKGLQPLLTKNIEKSRIHFSRDIKDSHRSSVHFICLGTPSSAQGHPQTEGILDLIEALLPAWQDTQYLIVKSTVPVGFCDQLQSKINEFLRQAGKNFLAHVVSNPEFLREGSTIQDTFHPARIVAGTKDITAQALMKSLYSSLNCPILFMSPRSSEMTKYAANTLLATKISTMNELSRLSESLDCDIEMIRQGVGFDSRIGDQFLMSGVGFGGSCLPKDLLALIAQAEQKDNPAVLLRSVVSINNTQKEFFFRKIRRELGDLRGKTVTLWGAAFKAGVEDLRESAILYFLPELLNAGASVKVFDPLAKSAVDKFVETLDYKENATVFSDQYEALEGAHAVVILTEWQGFAEADLTKMKNFMTNPAVFDGRNIFHPVKIKTAGLTYHGIGRSEDGL